MCQDNVASAHQKANYSYLIPIGYCQLQRIPFAQTQPELKWTEQVIRRENNMIMLLLSYADLSKGLRRKLLSIRQMEIKLTGLRMLSSGKIGLRKIFFIFQQTVTRAAGLMNAKLFLIRKQII